MWFPTHPSWLVALALLTAGCGSTRTERTLERVAKDWCLTIRAGQVLPVYPLTEDLQPGDVFAVQTPLAIQTRIYAQRGFLPLDQHVARLPFRVPSGDGKAAAAELPYAEFYRDGYWRSPWREPAARPGWTVSSEPGAAAEPVPAPRAAFPSYTFRVQRGTGAQLAIPISGVPVGLGVMSASSATGSVTIREAYTYGIDIQSLYASLLAWWDSDAEIRQTFGAIARAADSELYLRAVNRVYLASGVTVSLHNLDSLGAGVDAGLAPEVALLDLAISDPARAEASALAYRSTLEALSGLAPAAGAGAGGGFRFTQASQRAVTMDEDFDRPLVIGYLGFDVRVEQDGSLSPPIPSFALLNDRASIASFDTTPAQLGLERRWTALAVGGDEAAVEAVLADAAARVGGEFQRTFDASLEGRKARNAFLHAKNSYLDVGQVLEAELRLEQINAALDAALLQWEDNHAGR